MCQSHGPRPIARRDFLALTAAGAALPWCPGVLDGLAPTPFDAALASDRWIRTSRVPTAHGVAWPQVPGVTGIDRTDISLYHGVPGVLLFLTELAHASDGDTRRNALDDATRGADHLLATVRAAESPDPGLYTGLAGVAFALERVHAATGEARFRAGAVECIDRVVAAARPDRAGVGWGSGEADAWSSDIVSGAAGIGLGLLWAHDALGHPLALETASRAADRLAVLGEAAPGRDGNDGLLWRLSPAFERNYPNFSHGTAGIAYFLARSARATGSTAHLDAAVRGARYLEAVSHGSSDGRAVFHHEPGGEDLYYLSWCHGPAGTARLFDQLARQTGDAKWGAWVDDGARATVAFGVPETRSAGYWNNVSRCCGDAGVGAFFLAMEARTGDVRHGRFAERVGTWILTRSTADLDGQRWVQAENRVSPDQVQAQTGWMQGAAGVAAFLLHLDGRAKGRHPFVTLPDSPWPGG